MKQKRFWFGVALCGGALIALLSCIDVAKKYIQPSDFTPFCRWWVLLVLLSVCFYPLTALLFRRFSDRGYMFSKVLAIAIGGWLMWALSSIHIVKFTTVGCIVTLVLCAIANYGLLIFLCRRKKQSVLSFLGITDNSWIIPKAFWYEVFFFALMAILIYLKCFKPEANGTEKFMDYGFMTSMMKSEYMPPEDFWFSGTNLNYYYLGQYFATYLCKLSGVSANYGYNLALMMICALCMLLVYSLVARIFETFMEERASTLRLRGKKVGAAYALKTDFLSRLAGAFAGLAVTFAGNCQYYVYAKLVPIFREILSIEGSVSYWFPNATRYIGYQREGTGDLTIHEFPSYSFVLGDLHAHVINIMFVLTLLGVLFSWLLWRKKRMSDAVKGELRAINWKEELAQPHIIVLSFFIGLFHMTNYWDFPIYFVVCGAVILVSNAIICGFTKKTFQLTAVHAIEFLVISFVTSFLFTTRFDAMASGIAFCKKHTELYQMIVVWAFPLICIFAYLVNLVKEEIQRKKTEEPDRVKKNAFFTWLLHLKVSELFLIILGLCAAGLVLVPEVIYVVDIYGGDYARANTMFKLTYQAFIMSGIVIGFVLVRFLFLPKNGKQMFGGIMILFFLCQNLMYWQNSCNAWFGDIKKKENYKTLDAGAFINDNRNGDARAIAWINENIEGRPCILEMNGASYTDYNRVSVLTGCTTVLGWHDHEWLWKDDYDAVESRSADIKMIYMGEDVQTAKVLLKKYDVDYVYVGQLERSKYLTEGVIDYDYLRSLGEVVYEDLSEEHSPTFIVKVK